MRPGQRRSAPPLGSAWVLVISVPNVLRVREAPLLSCQEGNLTCGDG